MSGGTKLTFMAALLLGGCTGSDGRLTVRSLTTSPSMVAKPVPARIAEARGHYALGNVALALEGFRKAQRDDPASTDAILGIALCYDRMGRFELSRRYYESALALSPADPTLLEAFARSLDVQGRPLDAAEVRQELAARSVPDVSPSPEQSKTEVEVAQVTKPVQSVARPEVSAPVSIAAVPVPEASQAAANIQRAEATALAAKTPPKPAPVAVQQPRPAASVTIKLPPARPVEGPIEMAVSQPVIEAPSPAPQLAKARVPSGIRETPPTRGGPRLERLSLAEVALVTGAPTRWRGHVVKQAAASSTVRFVPLRTASHEVEVRLLNAARHQGLAARTRMALKGKGWDRVSIGDALRVRERSLVLYSAATRAAAKRLASQFGFAIAKEARPGQITVLLGRDFIRPTQKKA